MDKQRKKELKKEYLKNELLKQAEDENEILANWAKRKLGISLPRLDLETLNRLSDNELIDKIYFKIEEYISNKKRAERRKDDIKIVEELPLELKIVYYFNLIGTDIWEGGFEDYYVNTAGLHILDTINTFKVLNESSIIELLEKSIGVFLKWIDEGFDLWMDDINKWHKKAKTIDLNYYTRISNDYDFEKIDSDYKKIEKRFNDLIIHYIRNNIEKFQI